MSFANVYYERKVATAKPCYICKRPTEIVLSTIKTEDFLYTCENHLTDSGFASLIPPTAPSGPSADDIKKVIADYHVREAKKTEAAKADKADDKDTKDKKENEAKNGKDAKDATAPSSPSPAPGPASPIPVASPPATHRKFALHRQIFDMRKAEIKRREQGAKAREVGRGMPQVPRGMF